MNKWNKKSELTSPIGFWLCIGCAVGVSLGLVVGNSVLGIGLGITAGALVGVLQQKRQKSMDADH